MKASELIRELAEMIAEHGDVPVRGFDGAQCHELEAYSGYDDKGTREGRIIFYRKTRYAIKLSDGTIAKMDSQG